MAQLDHAEITTELLAAIGGVSHAYQLLKDNAITDQPRIAATLLQPAMQCLQAVLNNHVNPD